MIGIFKFSRLFTWHGLAQHSAGSLDPWLPGWHKRLTARHCDDMQNGRDVNHGGRSCNKFGVAGVLEAFALDKDTADDNCCACTERNFNKVTCQLSTPTHPSVGANESSRYHPRFLSFSPHLLRNMAMFNHSNEQP